MRLARVLVALIALVSSATITQGAQDRGLQFAGVVSGRRVALVIGNDAYAQAPLRNAVNDAKVMSAALRKYNFQVDLATDTSLRDLNRALDRFITQLQAGDVAMVYYAGHGVQAENENYLVPIDFKTQEEAEVKYEAYSASRVADRMAASGARLSILVLDACRNNPFRSSRATTRGLAPMDTGKGSLIAFATGPNRTADDNPSGQNGLFTSYVLQAMDEPGLSIEQVFSRARTKVYEASNGRQTPWLVSSVIGDFYFRPLAAPPVSAAIRPVAPTALVYLSGQALYKILGRTPPPESPSAQEAAKNEVSAAVKSAAPRLGSVAAFISEAAGIVWVDKGLDITDDIARAMSGTVSAPAARPAGALRPFVRMAYVNLQAVANESQLGKSFNARAIAATPGPEATALQTELQGTFWKALEPIVQQSARTAGAQIVFSLADSGLLWADDAMNLTAAVTARLDEASSGLRTGVSAPETGAAAGSAPNVAYVDVSQVISRSKLGQTFTARIQRFQKEKQDQIAALPAGADKTSATAAAQRDIEALNKTLQDEFSVALMPLVEKRAHAAGLKIVFRTNEAGILWIDPMLNITDALVKDLDAATAAKK